MPEKYDEKKEAIKKAALKVFAKYGYYKTTLDDIAETVGIKKNSLYYYFPNKESLFEEIVREESEKMFYHVKTAIAAVDDYEEKIKTFFREFMCYRTRHKKNLSISIENMIEIGQVVEQYFSEYFLKTKEMLSELLKEGIKNGQLETHDADLLSHVLLKFIPAYQREVIAKHKNVTIEEINIEEMKSTIMSLIEFIFLGIKKI